MNLHGLIWRCPDDPIGQFVMGSPIMDKAEIWSYRLVWYRSQLFDTCLEKSLWKMRRWIVDRLDRHGQLPDSRNPKREYHT